MAFCNACGKTLDSDARCCTNCGAPVPDSVAPAAGTPAPTASVTPSAASASSQVQPAPSGSGSGLIKVVLIIGGVIIGLAILAGIGLMWAGRRFAKDIHVEQNGQSATVETPWGSVKSNSDPMQVARDLGVNVYPGAKVLKEATSVQIGNMAVGTVQFETDDPIDKVESFYKAEFPNSTIESSQGDQRTIVTQMNNGLLSIVLRAEGGTTRILVSRTGRQPGDSVR